MRFKSILGAFIFFVIASMVAFFIFIQTKTFGRFATKVISDLSQKRAQTTVKMKSIGISLFPPGIELNQVRVKKELSSGRTFDSEFGKLGFYVGLIELEDRKLSLGEIRISDSMIVYKDPVKSEKELVEIDKHLIDEVFNFSKEIPFRIDTLLIDNSKIIINHDLVEAKRLKLFKVGDSFITRFHLGNLRPQSENDISIDEIWGDAEISRDNILLHRLKVQHDVHTMLIKGKIENYRLLKNADFEFSGESTLQVEHLKNAIHLPDLIKIEQGQAHLSFRAEYKKNKINGSADISVTNLESSILQAERFIANLELKNDILYLNQFNLLNGNEKAKLLGIRELVDFNSKKFLYQPLTIQADHLQLDNALRVLPSLSVLKGELTGELTFTYLNKNLEFRPKDGFIVDNLRLVVGQSKPFVIFKIDQTKLTSSSFRLIEKEFQMDAMVELNQSSLGIQGFVNSTQVKFKTSNSTINLEDFGNIANLDIKGRGPLDINVNGKLDDVILNFKGKTSGFEVLGYKLGEAEKDISISLGDSSVYINKLESLYRSTPISGTGSINYDNLDIALGINSPRASFHDLKEILAPIFSNLNFLPSDLDLHASLDAGIYGKTSLDLLKVKANVQFNDLIAYGESANNGEMTIGFNERVFTMSDFLANKGKGQIRGNFSYSVQSEQLKLDFEWDELVLSSFDISKKANLNLNGVLAGSLRGEGSKSNYLLKLEGKLEETYTSGYKFDDSNFDLKISPTSINGLVSLFGPTIKADFDYSMLADGPSKADIYINVPDVKPFAVAFLGAHLRGEDFTGKMELQVDSYFRGQFENMNFKLNLKEFLFNHESFQVNYNSPEAEFLVQDNSIKRWDLSIQEQDLYVQTKGHGTFGKSISLINEMHLNSRIFELLFSSVLSSEGFLRNIVRIDGQKSDYHLTASSKGTDLNLTLENIPFPINRLNYSAEYSNRRLVVQELKASLENGTIGLRGDIFFDDSEPDVNIKYYMDKAEIPIMGKSVINLTGEGIILGNGLPYNIGGEIRVNKAQIVNELNEFSPKTNALSQVRFLPPNQESPFGKLVNLNINVKLDNPARISNSLMDVSLAGEVMLLGSPSRLRGEGRLFSPANSSRVFFKNNEYSITSIDLNFSPKKAISNPDFDVQAITFISSYKVNAKAYGDLERFNFDLTSDPSLPRNSILSLIAFGYTDEMQNTLEQRDQQNLTQVGVGSFVFDRFKISDILNKQFGLQVNLGTVLEQSQTDSLLSGRSQEGQGTLGRTRSATKIELKKRLDEALSLSVSSTMGGSIGQRQSMNLNYSLSKKVQLEGVYELRTNAEGEEDIIDNSIGGDLKFRWTFK